MQINFTGNTIYLIDTSGLIMLESLFKYDNLVFEAIWEEIEELIQFDAFRTIDFVEDEINSYQGKEDFLKNWVRKWKKNFVVVTDSESINAAIPIINEEYNSGFFNARKQTEGKEEADPYLLWFYFYKNLLIYSFKRILTITLNAVKIMKVVIAIKTPILFTQKTKIIPEICPIKSIIPCDVDSGAG